MEDGSVEEARIPALNEQEAQLADRIRNLRSMPVDTDENAQAALAHIKDYVKASNANVDSNVFAQVLVYVLSLAGITATCEIAMAAFDEATRS